MLCVALASVCSAQPAADSLLPPPERNVPVPTADRLAVDQEGNLLLLATDVHRLCKLLVRFDYDSTYCIGGPGVSGDGFASPTELHVVNRQEVYVLDPNNRRIVVLGVDLAVLRELDFESTPLRTPDPEPPRYITPVSMAIGNTGELYVLSSEDYTVYKFDLYGRFERRFGGLDYGEGRLVRAGALVLTSDQTLYVSDTAAQSLTVYDKFGAFQYRLSPRLGRRWSAVRAVGRHLLFVHSTGVSIYDVDRQRAQSYRWREAGQDVRDAVWRAGELYLLSATGVSLHRLSLRD